MPDTETPTETVDTTVDTTTTESVDDGATPATDDTDLGDAGKAAIAAEREARRNAEKRLRDLEKSLKAYEDRDKTELQKWQERASEAEKRAEQAEFSALRNKVAASRGVPAASLTGKTEEELDASADELIAWRDANKPAAAPPAPKRNPASGGGLKSGASSTETINHDPKSAAAEALRRFRNSG
jgi:hypothetical protein